MHLDRPVLEARHHELISVCQRETFYLQPKYRDEKHSLWTNITCLQARFCIWCCQTQRRKFCRSEGTEWSGNYKTGCLLFLLFKHEISKLIEWMNYLRCRSIGNFEFFQDRQCCTNGSFLAISKPTPRVYYRLIMKRATLIALVVWEKDARKIFCLFQATFSVPFYQEMRWLMLI